MPRGEVLKYKTPALLDAVGMAYINDRLANNKPVLLTELCLALDVSAGTLRKYELRPAFTDVVKKLKTYVMRDYEAMLHSGKPVGAIFALKAISGGEWNDGGATMNVGNGEMTIKWTKAPKKN